MIRDMVKLDSAISSLRECDKQLRHTIASAAANAEPGQLNRIVGWLSDIQRILNEAESPVAAPLGGVHLNPPSTAVSQNPTPGNTSSRRGANKYPQFHRD